MSGLVGSGGNFFVVSVALCLSFVPVVSTLSSGYVRAPPPYRVVNAGLCDYKKKNKKKTSRPPYLLNS